MNEMSFKYCPVCKGELICGKISVPISRTPGIINGFTDSILFYSDEQIKYSKRHPIKSLFTENYMKITRFSAMEQPCIPAGYCEKCDRIFADIEIRDSYDAIGKESLPTYDMDYYCEEDENPYENPYENPIEEEHICTQEKDPYEEWEGLIEWDNPDDEK